MAPVPPHGECGPSAALDRLDAVPASAWDALKPDDNPFVAHDFLATLESSGSLRADLGWRAHHLLLGEQRAPRAAAPAYLKGNSHGEFVFDHAWADAHERLGLAYYPKLLVAVPYSPVPGPRLLAGHGPDAASRRSALVARLAAEAEALALSSVHCNFVGDDADASALANAGWIERHDVQYHWRNAGYACFDDFLAALNSKRRKEIRRERARVAADGWRFEWRAGAALDAGAIAVVHALYQATFARKGNYPALTRSCFAALASRLGEAFRVVLALRDGAIGACAVFLASRDTLYGRYWGAAEDSPGLHFEACYYQGIEHCIARGLTRFEPGAQGEHKLARGFLPVVTRSFHWIRHPRLRQAIDDAVARERDWVRRYIASLAPRSPFAERHS